MLEGVVLEDELGEEVGVFPEILRNIVLYASTHHKIVHEYGPLQMKMDGVRQEKTSRRLYLPPYLTNEQTKEVERSHSTQIPFQFVQNFKFHLAYHLSVVFAVGILVDLCN